VSCVAFFFQAEDGIRDFHVTGVQTCALPICAGATLIAFDCAEQEARLKIGRAELESARRSLEAKERLEALKAAGEIEVQIAKARSEERRVGTEWSTRGRADGGNTMRIRTTHT